MICVLTNQVAELQRQVQRNEESYKTSLNDLRQQQAAEMHECKQQQAQNTNSPQRGVTGIQGTSEQEVQMTDLPKARTKADVEIAIEQEVQQVLQMTDLPKARTGADVEVATEVKDKPVGAGPSNGGKIMSRHGQGAANKESEFGQ